MRRRPPWNLVAGGLLLALVAGAALLSLVWVPHDPNQMAVTERLAPPSRAHPLGTDPFGRDLLSRVMVGARTTRASAWRWFSSELGRASLWGPWPDWGGAGPTRS